VMFKKINLLKKRHCRKKMVERWAKRLKEKRRQRKNGVVNQCVL